MKHNIAKIASVFILAATLAACDSAEERAEKHFQSAQALISEGDTQRAAVEFRNVFELDPTHREARRLFAQMLEGDGNLSGALQNYLVIAEQYPDDGQSNAAIAKIAILTNRWDEAERFGRRAAELLPDDPETKLAIVNLDYRQAVIDGDAGRREELVATAEMLLESNPDTPLVDRMLFDWNLFKGRDREALVYIDRAIAEMPGEISLYQGRLAVLDNLGETPEIQKQLREMVELFPDVPRVRQTLYSWLMANGDKDAAEDFLREMADNATGENVDRETTGLIQFLRKERGPEAAILEIDRIVEKSGNPDFYRSLRAGIMFDLGERDEAIESLQSIVANSEPSAQVNNSKIVLARMLIATGNPVGARALIEEVLSEDTTHVAAIKLKADFLIEGDKASEAIVMLRTAQEQAPQDPEILILTAKAHERNGNRNLIGDLLARAAEVSNRRPQESIRLAAFLANQEQFGPAEQALIESLRRNANNPALLSELGNLYIRMEKLPEAQNIEGALRALDTPETKATADRIRLQILQAQNRSEDLIAMVESLSEGSSDRARATVTIMRTYLANGQYDKAKETIINALADDPDNLDLRFSEAVLTASEGDLVSARQKMRAILDEQPLAQNVWLALARTYVSEGDESGAEAILDEAIAKIPNSGNLKWAKAGYLERQGDIGGAIELYEALYDASSSSLIAANNLASLLSSYRQTPEALERAYTIARRLRGIPQPAFQDTYGWIAFLRGEYDQALEHLEPAAEGLPNDPLVQYHLARTYEVMNRPEDAAKVYERAIEILGNRTNEAMEDAATRLATVKAAMK